MSQPIAINNFSGGMRKDASAFAPNEVADLSGFWHHNGDLEPMQGPVVVLDGSSAANDLNELTVYSHSPYMTSDGKTCILARRASSLWVGVPQTAYPRAAFANGCPGLWDMNDETDWVSGWGNSVHRSVLANHGSVIVPLWSSNVRRFTRGAYLQETVVGSGSGNVGCDFIATDSFTLQLWVRWTGSLVGASSSLVEKTDSMGGYSLRINPNGTLVGTVKDSGGVNYAASTTTTVPTLAKNVWHHVAMTYAPSTYPIIYVDGVAATGANIAHTGTAGAWNPTNIGLVSIGGAGPTSSFIGDIGTTSIYKVAQNAATLLNNYTNEVQRYQDASAVTVTYKWFPLLGTANTGDPNYNSTPYIRARSKACPESFAQVNDYIYTTSDQPSPTDFMLVARPFILTSGQVVVSPGTAGGAFGLRLLGEH